MTHNSTGRLLLTRAGKVTLVLALAANAACNDFLVAENPGAIEEPDLNNPAYVTLLANGPVFALQAAFDDVAWWNGQMADEITNRGNNNPFIEEGQIDRRELHSDMSYINAFLYAPLQRARYSGEDVARRLTTILADSASRSLHVARAHAYAGYSYVFLSEMMCETPIDLGPPKSADEMFGDALNHFDQAITIGTAARQFALAQTPVNTNGALAADSVINLARVGSARAALNRNQTVEAAAFASQVPADFEFYSYYSANSTGQNNRVWNRIGAGSNGWLLFTPFEAMASDPRVPRIADGTARDGTPLSPASYTTFTNTIPGGPLLPESGIRFASGLEARYIIAETNGPVTTTLDFVNERRAAGNQAAVSLSGDALMAELRDQRARDFYLANYRLGDLRRYKQFYGVNLFPTGAYPGSTTGQVYNDDVDCWPLPRNEINDNPNIG